MEINGPILHIRPISSVWLKLYVKNATLSYVIRRLKIINVKREKNNLQSRISKVHCDGESCSSKCNYLKTCTISELFNCTKHKSITHTAQLEQ